LGCLLITQSNDGVAAEAAHTEIAIKTEAIYTYSTATTGLFAS